MLLTTSGAGVAAVALEVLLVAGTEELHFPRLSIAARIVSLKLSLRAVESGFRAMPREPERLVCSTAGPAK